MNDREAMQICDVIRETSFAAHKYLRHGHAEKIYENSLVNRLSTQGVQVERQTRLQVFDEDGTLLGDLLADLIVEGEIIIELKACKCLLDEHFAQILGYLRAARKRHGLLINFGAPKLQVKKLVL